MPQRILVPLDGSPLSLDALRHALETFDAADIVVLHVIDPIGAVYGAEGSGFLDAGGWYEREKERGEEICDEAAEMAAEYGRDPERVIEVGPPARTVVDYATDHQIDHVVMGSHGRTGIAHVLIGSVAEAVIRRSPVPVTVVR